MVKIDGNIDLSTGRWNTHSQPSPGRIRKLLRRLPIKTAIADYDELHIEFERPLTGAEGYYLAMNFGHDMPEIVEDPVTKIALWWD